MMMNKLYYGDNLEVLRKYIRDDSIDLCYIDPPFNSKRNYNQIYNNVGKEDRAQAQAFVDTWTWDDMAIEGFEDIVENRYGRFTTQTIHLITGLEKVLGKGSLMAYLISMTLRIAEIHRVLKPTGSFYFHCDPTASHYLKVLIDSIFCPRGGEFQNEIIWKRYAIHSLSRSRYDTISDTIFYYTKSNEAGYFSPDYEKLSREEIDRKFPHFEKETKRRFQHVALEQSSNASSKGEKRIIDGREVYSAIGWRWSQETFDERLKENPYIIYWTDSGKPRYKLYADEYKGKPTGNIWTDIPYLSSGDSERLGYPTQKPEALLERIIKTSTRKGDLILDAFCGCGTTISVSEKMQRHWIGIDITYQSISLILKRLEDSYGRKIYDKIELNGIPRDIESAIALANKKDDRIRKEFEKWCILTFSDNRAVINEKKGADGGIDGTALIHELTEEMEYDLRKIIFSVKSDKKPHVNYIRDLNGTMQRENSPMGYFITLYPPTKDMVEEAKRLGKYKNKYFGKDYDRIKIITVEQIIKGEIFDVPKMHSVKVVKSAKRVEGDEAQTALFDEWFLARTCRNI